MDTDELEPVIKPKEVDFDALSIEELNEYILELEKEIEKAKQYISSKGKVWKSRELIQYSIFFSSLKTGTNTETFLWLFFKNNYVINWLKIFFAFQINFLILYL